MSSISNSKTYRHYSQTSQISSQ